VIIEHRRPYPVHTVEVVGSNPISPNRTCSSRQGIKRPRPDFGIGRFFYDVTLNCRYRSSRRSLSGRAAWRRGSISLDRFQFLKPVFQHGAVLLLQDILSDMNDTVRIYPEDVLIKHRMMDFT
jgi:hypothetical protein